MRPVLFILVTAVIAQVAVAAPNKHAKNSIGSLKPQVHLIKRNNNANRFAALAGRTTMPGSMGRQNSQGSKQAKKDAARQKAEELTGKANPTRAEIKAARAAAYNAKMNNGGPAAASTGSIGSEGSLRRGDPDANRFAALASHSTMPGSMGRPNAQGKRQARKEAARLKAEELTGKANPTRAEIKAARTAAYNARMRNGGRAAASTGMGAQEPLIGGASQQASAPVQPPASQPRSGFFSRLGSLFGGKSAVPATPPNTANGDTTPAKPSRGKQIAKWAGFGLLGATALGLGVAGIGAMSENAKLKKAMEEGAAGHGPATVNNPDEQAQPPAPEQPAPEEVAPEQPVPEEVDNNFTREETGVAEDGADFEQAMDEESEMW